ncbi:MAG TPA: alpha/beta fold hydrolase [Trueperaceae bacterium]|nr:alpha/beta fold hydrolase [Trueperaceae bacterium]
MRRAMKYALAVMIATLSVAAAAQSGGAERAGSVYDLFQGPANLGEFGMTFTPDAKEPATPGPSGDLSGTSNSYVTIPGFLDLAATLSVGSDGSAREYRLEGTVQGVAIELVAEFHGAGLTMTATQAGQSSTVELAAAEPLYVIDNNFIDGIQVLARRAAASAGTEFDVAIVIPQVGLLGRATARAEETIEVLDHAGDSVSTRLVEIVMSVAGQAITSKVWLDEAGDIVVLEQLEGAVRFVRRATGTLGETGGDVGSASVTGARAFLDSSRQCVEATEVAVESTGETLAGILTLPVGAVAPVPTLLVLPGSGAVDLAGNALPVIRNSALEQLAHALGCHGYGVLRVAKLGIPPSTGDGNAVTIDTYAQNTADWLALLAGHPGVDPARIGLIGHSEGGLVSLYAAANNVVEPTVLVLIATAGRTFDVLLEEQFLARAREGGASNAQLEETAAQVTQALAAIKASSGTRLELAGGLADNPVAQMFANASGLLRSEMALDPTELIAALELPILIVQGEKDLQVTPVDGAALAAAAPGARLVAPPNLTHNLVDVAGDALDGLVPGPDAVISADLVLAVGAFLDEYLRPASR